jgi:AcrR family transcriptional regulator
MKTIKQIADELGVSKQAVYKRYRRKPHTFLDTYAHTENGTLYISEQGETLLTLPTSEAGGFLVRCPQPARARTYMDSPSV